MENIKAKNAMRTAEETAKLTYFSLKKKTSGRLSPAALHAAFFGKVIKAAFLWENPKTDL